MIINSYLTFSGNCREAMTFYRSCLGGELYIQTVNDSPMSGNLPQKMKDCVMHSTLTKGQMVLMGSDMVMDNGLIKGNAVSMLLQCNSEQEIRTTYAALAEGGRANHPVEPTFWGALFGDLTDKYGNHWMLNYEQPQ